MAGTNSAGNNHKTRAQHELDGTFRKDRHAELRSPEPPLGRPEIPADLDEVGQGEWERMMVRLEQSQSLSKVDDAAVYQYCQLYAETERIALRHEQLNFSIDRLEENLSDFKGEDFIKLIQEQTTLQKLISKCTDQLRSSRMAIRQYLVEFGLTPASRGRIKLPAKQKDVDKFAERQRARPTLSVVQ